MTQPDQHRAAATPIMEVEVRDPTATRCPPASVGEIWFKGPNVIRGYWNKPEATAETIVDGWLRTGDLGRIDDEGFLYIEDRAKDMVLRGGENVYCAEVEAAIYEHPAVYEAAVFGVPHERLGEEVAVAVVPRAGDDHRPGRAPAFLARAHRPVQGADARSCPFDERAPPQRRRQDPQARAPRRAHRTRLTPPIRWLGWGRAWACGLTARRPPTAPTRARAKTHVTLWSTAQPLARRRAR